MAKLSARGRKELARLSKESIPTDPDSLTNWRKHTYAFMSDRTILQKTDVRFKHGDERHSYGWTVWTKVKDLEGALERTIERLIAAGYTRE